MDKLLSKCKRKFSVKRNNLLFQGKNFKNQQININKSHKIHSINKKIPVFKALFMGQGPMINNM